MKGDKSEVMDIDNVDTAKFPEFLNARRFECELQPGDVLFIPGIACECVAIRL